MTSANESATTSATDRATSSSIHWPPGWSPAEKHVSSRNEITIPAPASTVWAWLVGAESWPDWYANSDDIHFLSHAGPDLRDRSRFRWQTFGARLTSKVLEFEAPSRLAWDAHGVGIAAYHAWLLTPLNDGTTHVLTEETQSGWRARLAHRFAPTRLSTQHQVWLEGLSRQSQTGLPGRN